MASQIVFLREFLVVFYGNEISIGIILASWLVWGALGSLAFGRFSDKIQNGTFIFSMCQLGLFFVLPLTLLGIRSSRVLLGVTAGEILGYYPIAAAAFILLSLSCVMLGFMFSMASVYMHG